MINMERCDKHGVCAHHTLSICKLCTAENGGTLPAIAQHLKPKMPLLEEVEQAFERDVVDGGTPTLDEYHAVKFAWEYISRHFGH